jgi:hypothetical protein
LLSKWIDDCKNLAGDTGRRAFTNTTIKAVENQLEKVEHPEDPNDIDIYIEIPLLGRLLYMASPNGSQNYQNRP